MSLVETNGNEYQQSPLQNCYWHYLFPCFWLWIKNKSRWLKPTAMNIKNLYKIGNWHYIFLCRLALADGIKKILTLALAKT
ncbi:hypothetical protein [Pedobacter paludis]|uniref:Uncharacterized protein n=1 Tax=Pedobacter paludis TaxID=2203212 RepID=A0A317EZE5_9SPHI|nr:hypothetical protein [Pedobacter paludis]PWS32281.1 hypothetical protein DF947_10970 [Pedobacter paludis]